MRKEESGESMNAPHILETVLEARSLRTHLPAAVLYKKVSPSIALRKE
jgi:hypothetical protein